MASPHHRHQSSLEGVIDFSSSPALSEGDRIQAQERFLRIIEHFEHLAAATPTSNGYNRPLLLRLTHEFAISEKSKNNVLQAFFRAIQLPMTGSLDNINLVLTDSKHGLLDKINGYAEYLVDNFFLPLKASTRKTPQPSPAYHSATSSTRAGRQNLAGTSDRLRTLRGDCLRRDRHRCVISRVFDQKEAITRGIQHGEDGAQDDEGHAIAGQIFDVLEVAHILPHSLNKTGPGQSLDTSRQTALQILNMFDNDISQLIEGPEIDRPRNALTLTHSLHQFFGDFQIYFEPVSGSSDEPNTYRIDTFLPRFTLSNLLPVTRTLYLTPTRTIDPPSPRLLAVHRAIAFILHLSGAGRYIDKMLEDWEDSTIQADGSTPLDRMMKLRINDWLST